MSGCMYCTKQILQITEDVSSFYGKLFSLYFIFFTNVVTK